MHESGVPGWVVALALVIAFSAAVAVAAVATGLSIILLPALAVVALGYGLYLVIAASRRRARFYWRVDRIGAIDDARWFRRRSRLSRGET